MARYPCISKAINTRQAHLLESALAHAARIGFMPTQFLTIHWRLTQYIDTPFNGLQRSLESMGKWLQRRGVSVVWLWVREAERHQTEHVHIALYCPAHLAPALEAALGRWLKAEEPRALDVTPIYNARRLVTSYFLKGGNKAVREAFPVPSSKRASPHQGVIDGKRVGVSRSIGAEAIRAYFADAEPRPSKAQSHARTEFSPAMRERMSA